MKRGWIFRWRNSLGYNLLQKKKPQNIACPTILRNQSFLCTVDIVLLDENCSFRQKEGGLPAVLLPIPATPLHKTAVWGERCSVLCWVPKGLQPGLGLEKCSAVLQEQPLDMDKAGFISTKVLEEICKVGSLVDFLAMCPFGFARPKNVQTPESGLYSRTGLCVALLSAGLQVYVFAFVCITRISSRNLMNKNLI